jgi:hypothetical protein
VERKPALVGLAINFALPTDVQQTELDASLEINKHDAALCTQDKGQGDGQPQNISQSAGPRKSVSKTGFDHGHPVMRSSVVHFTFNDRDLRVKK